MAEKKTDKQWKVSLELIVVVMLGVTAICTAWASWISSVHAANQDANYAESNNLASEGNSEYNAGIQDLMMDMLVFNNVNDLMIDLHFAERQGDSNEAEKLEWKIDELVAGSMSDGLYDAFNWSISEGEKRGESVSPFDMDGFVDSYFEVALELLAESDRLFEQGQQDSAHSDAYGLTTVVYAVVLFLLGIVSTFKDEKYKKAVIIISGVAFIATTIYMFTIPLPTGMFGS